ncbi:MAG: isoprenyl transferase [Dehalococcoidales bacterium]|nr:isoprenyl transferase [Dehalococcoidales bacterium]
MLELTTLPRHVAFILDGNGRWAEKRGLSRLDGHRAGVKNIRRVLECLGRYGIPFVTFYAFSTENWNRPAEEVNGLFELLAEVVAKESRELHKKGVRIRHIGRLQGLPEHVQECITQAVKLTENNRGMTLTIALNYGGRAEILDAVARIIADGVPASEISEELFARYLYTAGLPDVDLVIRTSGELRISNFLLWQSAYSEFYFTPVLWPDFDEEELEQALLAYSRRQRRFGGL